METEKQENKKACPQELTFSSLPVCLVMTLCGRSWIPTLRMRKGAENVRCLAWLRTARTLPVADLSPVLLAGFPSHAPACHQARPWGPGSPTPASVLLWVGAPLGRRGWSAWLWPTSPGPPRPRVTPEDPQAMGRPCGGPRRGRGCSPAARPARPARAALLLTCLFLLSPMLWQWCPALMRQYLVQPQAALFQVIS